MAERFVQKTTTHPYPAFSDRADAGRRLDEMVGPRVGEEAVVLAIPRGGVPVAVPLAARTGQGPELVFLRKLPIPSSPEAGFGAVALDGNVVLNRPMVDRLQLDQATIDRVVGDVLGEVRRRAETYGNDGGLPEVAGRDVYLVDDGLASGFTMIAAARMVRSREPARLNLAVPVSPSGSMERVECEFDRMFCLVAQEGGRFAVASFYRSFPDLTDAEVKRLLRGVGSNHLT
ncbi:MAG: phosphoribosyltransferase [Planctomycetota bacterium]